MDETQQPTSSSPSQQPNLVPKHANTSKILLLLIPVLLITIIISSFVTYYFINAQAKAEKELLNEQSQAKLEAASNQNESLTEQIKTLKENQNVCSDSDGGQDYYVNGEVDYKELDAQKSIKATGGGSDDCQDKTTLREYYCDDSKKVQYSYFDCANGCSNGACIK